MKWFIPYFLIMFISFSAQGEEIFSFPTPDLAKRIQQTGDVCELKTAADPDCHIYLGWGHSRNSHDAIEEISDEKVACGIGMGCNSSTAGIGALEQKTDYWRWQRGSNGTWRNWAQQGTQNGGLNPIILDASDALETGKLLDQNSHLGFMRMTQYHWLQLHNFAANELLNKTCSSVKIELICPEDDLQDKELSKRLGAYKNKYKENSTKKLDIKYQNEIEIINRVEPLKGCFSETDKPDGFPTKCGQKIEVDALTKIAPHCQEWVKKIQEIPQHDWTTPKSLPRPEKYSHPTTGIIN